MTDLTDSNSKWINAFQDPLATLYTFTCCTALADLNGDGDSKLVVADLGTGMYNMKLKVYKGTTVMSENAIIDLPTAVVAFFMDQAEPRIPAIAVASGPSIYVYKNLKPYYKFTLPSLIINSIESEIWDAVKTGKLDTKSLFDGLTALKEKIPSYEMTTRSLRYLLLADYERDAFIQQQIEEPLKRLTIITCMTTLKRASETPDAVDCIIIGTEHCQVHVLDSEAFTVIATLTVPSVPVFLAAAGLIDVEYRLIVCCRDAKIYTAKRSVTKVEKPTIELPSQAVGIVRIRKQIIVGCMDDFLRCFSVKGKIQWQMQMPSDIISLELMDYRPKNVAAVIVALGNGEIHIYKDIFLIDSIKCDQVVVAMKFGSFGREEGALVLCHRGGGLNVKLLKRTAKFEEKAATPGPPIAQSQKLNIPKKTKIYVDQTLRERDNAVKMHQTFQKDMFMLRLKTAQEYMKTLDKSINPIATTQQNEMLKLSAEVQGFGPTFRLIIYLQCVSAQPIINLYIGFLFNTALYEVEKPYIPVGMLVPGIQYPFQTKIQCLSDKGLSDELKVYVCRGNEPTPLIAALITMPVSDVSLIE